jgi:hypothetical protein
VPHNNDDDNNNNNNNNNNNVASGYLTKYYTIKAYGGVYGIHGFMFPWLWH